jgi:hypothetical protein
MQCGSSDLGSNINFLNVYVPLSDSYQNERLLIENFSVQEKIKEGTCLDISANVC